MASHEGQEPCCLCRLCRPGSAVCCLSEECLTPLCVGHVTMVMASLWHHQSQLSPAVWGGYKACTHSSLPHILLFSPVEYAVGALMLRRGRGRGRSQLLLCHVCTQVERLCVGAGAIQLNSLLHPTDCTCVCVRASVHVRMLVCTCAPVLTLLWVHRESFCPMCVDAHKILELSKGKLHYAD